VIVQTNSDIKTHFRLKKCAMCTVSLEQYVSKYGYGFVLCNVF